MGCSLSEKAPSVLVIAVDSLPYDAILCTEGENYKGFKIVCDEMTRFTHAYTTSILAVPALGSLLTGLYPYDHEARHNGSTLSAQYKLSSEVALEKSYRTSFYSGGPPIFRKTGLHQGFEVFDDNINISLNKYYRPSIESFNLFLNWLKSDSSKDPYFSFIYVPDLQFSYFKTIDNKGFEREHTYKGQMLEFDESLDHLITELKKQDRWNNSWVFIVGLNGLTNPRANEVIGTNLYHENIRVMLFAKKPEKERDQKKAWVVDMPVSLVDIGKTIFEIIGESSQEGILPEVKGISLKHKLETLKKDDSLQRYILIESAWPLWREIGKTRYALQVDDYLILYDKNLKIFNTVVDRNQIYPLNRKSIGSNSIISNAIEVLNSIDPKPWDGIPEVDIDRYQFATKFWTAPDLDSDLLSDLKHLEKVDVKVQAWAVDYFFRHNQWAQILGLFESRIEDENPNPVTIYNVLARESLNLPKIKIKDNGEAQCLMLLEKNDVQHEASCANKLFITLLKWREANTQAKENLYRDSFIKNFKYYTIEKEIQKINYSQGYLWDTRENYINETRYAHDIDIEAVLNLKEFKKFKEALLLNN